MSRIRNIKPDFFDDEGLATVSPWARLCFIGLWTEADREGRLEDRPGRLKARLFPFDKVNVEHLIDELVTEGCVVRYRVDGERLLFIPRFSKHQYISKREPASTLPGMNPSDAGTVPVLYQSCTSPTDMDRDIGHGSGQGTCDNGASAGHTPTQPIPIIATGPHRSHAFCSIACVPSFLHQEFRAGLNREDQDAADTELRQGYLAHVGSWPKGKPTGDAIAFWRSWYREKYAPPPPVFGKGKTAGNQKALEQFLEMNRRQANGVD